ncbi:hypothetical protein A2Z00_03495 [Candidatus Gottesmanbacteria bacterium RBG_13_45_10]|uniref:Type II secretion system protein GspG C-terminal domain-containing protein n=1 Tax=Candidatus Gottesmanbacteria bacterium RBG_13_45_10 TaxID=1798370 RepID=A0A1F5ZGN6_9BACT|nr:MAG: hypothetical protein A2Z00_03495 [Candidatus Gottesmanbacteria bacterium RBG_13_45_10]
MRETKKRKGFTLMELLIVIAIIGILISMGVVSFSSAQKTSRDSKRRADMKAIQNAWEQYNSDNNGSYPASCSVSATYLPAGLPTDPKTGWPAYVGTCSASSYCYCASLESGVGNSSSSNCAYGSGSWFCVSSLQ